MIVFKEIKTFPVLLIILLQICAKSLGDILPQSSTQLTISPKAIAPKDQVMIIDHPVGINMFTEGNNSKIIRLKRAACRTKSCLKRCIKESGKDCHISSTSPLASPLTSPLALPLTSPLRSPSTPPIYVPPAAQNRTTATRKSPPKPPITNKHTSVRNVKGIQLPGGWLAYPDDPGKESSTSTTPRTYSKTKPPTAPGKQISTIQRTKHTTKRINTSPNQINIIETPHEYIIPKSKINISKPSNQKPSYPNDMHNHGYHIHERNHQTGNLNHFRTAHNSKKNLLMNRAFYQPTTTLVISRSSNDYVTHSIINQVGNMLTDYFG